MKTRFNRIISLFAAITLLLGSAACDKYLDVVPNDGIPSVDMAFNLRSTAIRYLATCYAYMTNDGDPGGDSAFLTGDELWDLVGRTISLYDYNRREPRVPNTYFQIARGLQSKTNVIANDWASMYQGIRCCDILCENIDRVPDMSLTEKLQWKAEVTFLKAYYHFNLIRKWGPVPIIRESLPMDSDMETVRVYREPIDTCFNFVLELLDKAMPDLPLENYTNSDELGRANRAICAALKARVAVYAASPLFNGNEEEFTLVDNRGVHLFPQKTAEEKLARWKYAVTACKEAIDVCQEANRRLYDVDNGIALEYVMVDTLKRTLTLRSAMNQRWTSELIWGNTQTKAPITRFQQWTMPNLMYPTYDHSTWGYRFIGVPLKIVDQFYTRNGLPTNNDLEWAGVNLMGLLTPPEDHSYYLEAGYPTVQMNVNREPRFYSFLGFDGGKWLGMLGSYQNLVPEQILHIECRNGGVHGKSGNDVGPVTGYFPKKLYPIQCRVKGKNDGTVYWFPWPMFRLTDLYLLYAEAINEAEGPDGEHSADLFKYLDAVRARAGIPDVKTSWDTYSNSPGYYKTQYGMREIIHRERLIELCFEGQRFWDIRRWKVAASEYQKGIYGFSIASAAPEDYYARRLVSAQSFGLKDYFWPIYTYYLERNPNLVQNLDW